MYIVLILSAVGIHDIGPISGSLSFLLFCVQSLTPILLIILEYIFASLSRIYSFGTGLWCRILSRLYVHRALHPGKPNCLVALESLNTVFFFAGSILLHYIFSFDRFIAVAARINVLECEVLVINDIGDVIGTVAVTGCNVTKAAIAFGALSWYIDFPQVR